MNRHQMKLLLFFVFSFVLFQLFGQGCLQKEYQGNISLTSILKLDNSGTAGNGGTYDGKLIAHHYEPGFTCEGKSSPQSTIIREANGKWYYNENTERKCMSIQNQAILENEVQLKINFRYATYNGKRYYIEPPTALSDNLCLHSKNAVGGYSGGLGSPEDPFTICNSEQLLFLSKNSSDWNKSFLLLTDIDFNNIQEFYTPIGNRLIPFTGYFNGNGKVIYNLNIHNIDPTSPQGLFGRISSAFIVDLIMVNFNIEGQSSVGSLVGLVDNLEATNTSDPFSLIQNCFSISGKVHGVNRVGGLIGHVNSGQIISSGTDKVSVNSVEKAFNAYRIGGFIGEIDFKTNLHQTFSISNVYGEGKVGGLVGLLSSQTIVDPINDVYSAPNFIASRVTISFSDSHVFGTESVGGFMGEQSGGEIYDSYSNGTVTAQYFNSKDSINNLGISGHSVFVGKLGANGLIYNVYSSGRLKGTFEPQLSGGIAAIAVNTSNVFRSYYDDNNIGVAGTHVLTDQLIRSSTFVGWGLGTIWTLDEGVNPPSLN